MTCDDVRGRLMSGAGSKDVDDHVAGCAACRSHLARLDVAAELLGDATLWEEPSPELESQIVGLVHATRAARPRRSVVWWIAAAALVVVVGVVITNPRGPDWTVTLAGTDMAPTASAIVDGWNSPVGTEVRVRVRDLGAAPDGQAFELWFSGDGGIVSAGTFKDGTEVTLAVAVARKEFPRLWITLEPLDDDATPSGQTVLRTG